MSHPVPCTAQNRDAIAPRNAREGQRVHEHRQDCTRAIASRGNKPASSRSVQVNGPDRAHAEPRPEHRHSSATETQPCWIPSWISQTSPTECRDNIWDYLISTDYLNDLKNGPMLATEMASHGRPALWNSPCARA